MAVQSVAQPTNRTQAAFSYWKQDGAIGGFQQ